MWAVFMFQGHGKIISLRFLPRIFSFSQGQNFKKIFYHTTFLYLCILGKKNVSECQTSFVLAIFLWSLLWPHIIIGKYHFFPLQGVKTENVSDLQTVSYGTTRWNRTLIRYCTYSL